MNTSEPPHQRHSGPDPLRPPTRLPFPGAPPAGGWSTLPVAERLIQALERLIDLNDQTARLTTLYRAELELQQAAAQRNANVRDPRELRARSAADAGHQLER